MIPRGCVSAVALLACASSSSLSAQVPVVISTGSAAVDVGNIFDIPVDITSVTDLYDYQFDLTFNPGVLQLLNVTEGAFLAGSPPVRSTSFFGGIIDNTGGTVTFVLGTAIGLVPGATGTGTLADLSFQAIGLGTSSLDVSGGTLENSSVPRGDIPFTISNGSVTAATPVPEPGAWTLTAPLLALVFLQRRNTKKRLALNATHRAR